MVSERPTDASTWRCTRFDGGVNFYAYVDNQPATESDPSGLVATKGCSPRRAKAINDAAAAAKKAVQGGCISCAQERQAVIDAIDNTTYHCEESLRFGGATACAGAWGPGMARTGRDVTFYGPWFYGWCGCRQGLLLHEIAHNVTGKEHDGKDMTVDNMARRCFPCVVKSIGDAPKP